MKANLIPHPLLLAAAVVLTHFSTPVAAATAVVAGAETNATLSLVPASAQAVRLNLTNAANLAWTVEQSSDLINWFEVERVKPFNGVYHRAYPSAAGAAVFYRAFYDPARQDIVSFTTNALVLPAVPFNYAAPVLPASFLVNPVLAQDTTPPNNPTTDAGATLGRVLFYDKRLSTNQTIACASCHQPAHGFSDPRRFSVGWDDSAGTRNAMGLTHARWYLRRHFFWDERANTLEDQVLQPIQNPIEMGMTLAALTNRLAAEPFYTNLFTQAFGSPDVTTNRISRALAQFVRSIVAVQSKYDAGVTNNFADFNPQENLGRQIFFGQVGNPPATCAACHGTDNFTAGAALNNNGLELPYVDPGVGGITGNPANLGKFKAPSLRNIALTAPYMHDGRFTNLEQVVDFYDSGVVDNPNLSPPLRNPDGTVRRLHLTPQQKSALVTFLKTLTDPNLATDPKLSDPFNYGD
ncbi:MAG TPA: cytochrome c peroxidase [Verrucomicrobiae bacterium]|nr:cytochrome c peroxidase [Verrucomicrobiae bacterium]